jgi:hypothetical protein
MREIKYDTQSLKDSIAHRKKHIKTLEQAIDVERTEINRERELIELLERKAKLQTEIVIDAEKGEVANADNHG